MAWRAHPDWLLVVAANRDETHDRPTADLDVWPASDVIAGRDLRSGGSWLGISSGHARFAGVTNVADPQRRDRDAPSRGHLVRDFLESGNSPEADAERMNPFNLLLATDRDAMIVTNRPDLSRRILSPGVHGVSNGIEPVEWETTGRLKRAVTRNLEDRSATAETLLDRLMDVLDDREPTSPGPGGLFVQGQVYGTRCSTSIAINGRGRGAIRERRFGPAGERTGETELAFIWPA